MPELLTQEPPASPLGGRLHLGMVAGFIPERWPASNRNPWPTSVGKSRGFSDVPQTRAAWATA
jgi:hypothetical protein